MRTPLLGAILAGCSAACAVDDGAPVTMEPTPGVPWKHPAKWPYQVESPRLIVHYQATGDRSMAQSVLADVEDAWQKQVVDQGARAPIDGVGPDDRFDVWLQRGIDELYVSSTGPNPATQYDDAFTTMVLDPWGQYGGAEMPANVFHEFRHASQGVDDWDEHIEFFEAEATLWETAYFGYARLPAVWADYQAHPDWTPFKDDHYTTWFMYGGSMFLLYIRQHVFGGSLTWANDVWLGCRNPPGVNEPDFADSLQAVLAAHGTSLFGELTSFARARWYTGPNADGTLESGDIIPAVASVDHVRGSGAARTRFVVRPRMLGTVYTVVRQAPTDGATINISVTSVDAGAQAVVQLVGQGAADRVLDLSAGPTSVLYRAGIAVIAVTALPADGVFDPDTVSTGAIKVTVALDP